ncbi:MAG: cellobiose transport system permease protein [Clostridiales bacterium]|nr:cellobiose transport system permease protein [Clostridiales bacterium]
MILIETKTEDIKRRARTRRNKINYARYGYYFILPFFITYAIFQLYPLLYTIFLSFTKYIKPAGGAPIGPEFIGLGNFVDIFTNNRAFGEFTFGAFSNTITMWTINFIPQILISLLLAAWFTDKRLSIRAQGTYKMLIYLPNIMTAASVSLLFYTFFSFPQGPVNILLQRVGLLEEPFDFLNDGTSTRLIVSFINFWMWYGNTTIILVAGILGIDPELFEVAEIDGATSGQIFRKITLPLIQPILLYVLVTSLIGGMQMYDVPKLMTRAASPATNQIRTVTMYIQELVGTGSKNYGHAAAISVLLFIITAILSLTLFWLMRERDTEGQKR